jgi:hypothetical protein
MDTLNYSWDRFEQYPHNIARHNLLQHNLRSFSDRLDAQNNRLFDAKYAAVDLLDFVTDASSKFSLLHKPNFEERE